MHHPDRSLSYSCHQLELGKAKQNIVFTYDMRVENSYLPYIYKIKDETLRHVSSLQTLLNISDILFTVTSDTTYRDTKHIQDGIIMSFIPDHDIPIYINQYLFRTYDNVMREEFPSMISEEWHHAARKKNIRERSLLEDMIREGTAAHFSEYYAKKPVCYRDWYSQKDRMLFQNIARLEMKKIPWSPAEYNRWMAGTDPSIPYGMGYVLGYEAVARYLIDHPKTHPVNTITIKPQDFFPYLSRVGKENI